MQKQEFTASWLKWIFCSLFPTVASDYYFNHKLMYYFLQ